MRSLNTKKVHITEIIRYFGVLINGLGAQTMKVLAQMMALSFFIGCGETPNQQNPVQEDAFIQAGTCDLDWSEWKTLTQVQQITVSGDTWPIEPVQTRILSSEAEAAAFQTQSGWTLGPVNYGENTVLFAAVGASSTCGFSQPEWTVRYQTQGMFAAHLEFSATDTSGGCDAVCDMVEEQPLAVLIPHDAVPATGAFSVCATRFDVCE